MCGRFGYIFSGPMRAWYERTIGSVPQEGLAVESRYNIAPTQPIVVATADGAGGGARLQVEVAKWGFPGPGGKPVFNARIESAQTSPMWASHWGRDHCVIPATGFYEWTGSGAAKTPFWITRTDESPLLFAGLVGGSPAAPVASILTCLPNQFMAGLHNRMPVVLEPEEASRWLTRSDGWEDLARPAKEVLDGHAVDKAVGDSHAQGPMLIEPLKAWF